MLSTEADGEDLLRRLRELVAIPSVSSEADAATMGQAAAWLSRELACAGARVVETDLHPVVMGQLEGPPGTPTILVYGHYDVQPASHPELWDSPPFEMTIAGGMVRGRGVTDDKGPMMIATEATRRFVAQEGRPPLNVKFLLEGEEEIGSPSLEAFVRRHMRELAADLVVSADGAMWRPSEPSVSISSKGLASLDIEVTGPVSDLHSGRYGGTVANPLHALSEIVASLHRSDGRVAVAGFYEGIPELSRPRREEIAKVGFDELEYQSALDVPSLFGEPGFDTLERLWERPTLEVNGIVGGGKQSVVPGVAVAHVSCRLVPGQDPEWILAAIRDHVLARPAPGVRVVVRADPGAVRAYSISPDHPGIRAAVEALEATYPSQPVLVAKIGGTVPATSLFEDELGAKTIFFSFSTADEKLHAPNEFMRLARFQEGVQAWQSLWRLLAERRDLGTFPETQRG